MFRDEPDRIDTYWLDKSRSKGFAEVAEFDVRDSILLEEEIKEF